MTLKLLYFPTDSLHWYSEENNSRNECLLILCLTFTSYPCISKQQILNLREEQKVKLTYVFESIIYYCIEIMLLYKRDKLYYKNDFNLKENDHRAEL